MRLHQQLGGVLPGLRSFDRMIDQRESWREHHGPSTAWLSPMVKVGDAGDAEPEETVDDQIGV